jgi:hypothetical protein
MGNCLHGQAVIMKFKYHQMSNLLKDRLDKALDFNQIAKSIAPG